jgi:hypothetical protein
MGGLGGNGQLPREMGTFWGAGRYCGAVPNAQQLPNSLRGSNACNAAIGKRLAKCEKLLIAGHFCEHWLILSALSLT